MEVNSTALTPAAITGIPKISYSVRRKNEYRGTKTFYARITGNSMEGVGIQDGDIVVIDKSLEPANDQIAVCFIDGEFTLKRIHLENGRLFLMPHNPAFPPIEITEENHFQVWGIVTYVIKRV